MTIAAAQQTPARARQFPPGTLTRIADLPPSPFRTRIEALAEKARQRALEALGAFHFTELDLNSLRADAEGGLYYEDNFLATPETAPAQTDSGTGAPLAASVPVSPFPGSLVFHSKPGAPNVLYLNFSGENVTNTAWNNSLGRAEIPAVAFSTDSDFSTFSSTEQAAIKRIWQRVAEDYAPFNLDVTTERPATFGTRTAHALITRNTDANGAPNPSSTAAGVAYINVFARSSFADFRPAWIYYNKLSSNESYIAEAVSHETGHNLGLSHDGKTDGTEYYEGHGSGDTSWGPIMGMSYNRNVSQWSKGEYYLANNSQDDLATLSAKLAYRTDDHGNLPSTATPLVITGETNIVSTTPEADPENLNPSNKGILEGNTDVDLFTFATGTGSIKLTVNPWIMPSGACGGNLDVLLELYDEAGALRAANNPASQTLAQIQTTLTAGNYYLHVRNTGVGNPTNSPPTGYTAYASIGQYFISGYVVAPPAPPPPVQLIASVNNPAWGSVAPTNAAYEAGSTAQVLAAAAPYHRFMGWTNDAAGTNNPLILVLDADAEVEALFEEILTANHPTPQWWLASCGYTNDFETAVTHTGANGVPLWQSYIAGLNPNDPDDQFRLGLAPRAGGNRDVLSWNTVTGRVYTIWWSSDLVNGFTLLPGASDLPWTTQRFTNTLNSPSSAVLYRIAVRKL